jgi:hypothetical protein
MRMLEECVWGHEPAHRGRVVSSPKIIKARFRIPFFTGQFIAVATRSSDNALAAKRIKVRLIQNIPQRVRHYARRPQVVRHCNKRYCRPNPASRFAFPRGKCTPLYSPMHRFPRLGRSRLHTSRSYHSTSLPACHRRRICNSHQPLTLIHLPRCRRSLPSLAVRCSPNAAPQQRLGHEIGTRFTPAKILSRNCVCPLSSSIRTSLRFST